LRKNAHICTFHYFKENYYQSRTSTYYQINDKKLSVKRNIYLVKSTKSRKNLLHVYRCLCHLLHVYRRLIYIFSTCNFLFCVCMCAYARARTHTHVCMYTFQLLTNLSCIATRPMWSESSWTFSYSPNLCICIVFNDREFYKI